MTDSVQNSPAAGAAADLAPPDSADHADGTDGTDGTDGNPAWSSPSARLALASLQTRAWELSRLAEETAEALARVGTPRSDGFTDIARRSIPRWHFPMLNDTERNEALALALHKQIPSGSLVLEIGTGTGFLAMAAVKAGAGHVVTCEENPLMAEIARQTIARHGMSDAITVVPRRSTALAVGRELPRRADVLVSEIVDCGLVGEGLFPAVRHAREHLLAPGGLMLPAGAQLHGQLIESAAVAGLNRVRSAADYDVSLMNTVATPGHFPVRLNTWPHRTLSQRALLARWDLRSAPLLPGSRRVALPVTDGGRADGLVVWFALDYGEGIVLGNEPEKTASHWSQALVPLDGTAALRPGGLFDLELSWSDSRLTAR
jgi:type II protein arginine methyltransferase